MSEQKNTPKIEDIINHVLSGDMQKNALDFVDFLSANGFQTEYNPDEYEENKWTGAIGGVVGDSIGYMFVRAGTNCPDPWNIWLNEYEFDYSSSAEDDELKEFIWKNVNGCSKCNPNWENCGGGERVVLGKKFDRLCHSPMSFYVPDAQELEKLKKLLLKVKQKRDNDRCAE